MTRNVNGLLESHFKGKPQIAEMLDPHRGRVLKAYYIGEDSVVGLCDGVDSWVSNVLSCPAAMKLAKRIEEFKDGVVHAFDTIVPRRRVVLDGDPSTAPVQRRRVHVD